MLLTSFPVPYSSVEAEFASPFDVSKSVLRLRGASKSSVFDVTRHEAAVGKVSAKRVVLQRVIPGFGNSFKPIFFGHFKATNGGTVLKGYFAIHWVVRIFMTCWLGICIAVPTLSLCHIFFRPLGLGTLVPIAVFFCGLAFACFLRWLSQGDVVWLGKFIRHALEDSNSREPLRP